MQSDPQSDAAANSLAMLDAFKNGISPSELNLALQQAMVRSQQSFNCGDKNVVTLGDITAMFDALDLDNTKQAVRAQTSCKVLLDRFRFYIDTALPDENTYVEDKHGVFTRVSDDNLLQALRQIYQNTHGHEADWSNKEVLAAVDLLKTLIPVNNRGVISRRYIYVPITDSFWDTAGGELIASLPADAKCFRRLFDNPVNVATGSPINPDHGVAFTEDGWTEEHKTLLINAYNDAYMDATATNFMNDTVLEDFEFIKGWAQDENGQVNHGRYMDLLMTYADVFIGGEQKPMGQVACIGGHGNGKSLYRGSLLTIVGTNNLLEITNSDIQKSQDVIGDIRRGGLLNFPDEEDTGDGGMGSAAQRVFKNMGDHKTVSSVAKYSGNKVSAAFDMTDIHTYNALPTFTGKGAGACIDRIRPIFFQHNFRADNQGRNGIYRVEEDIFTRETIAKLVGQAMGYARYCIENKMWPESEEMRAHRSSMMEDTDPIEEFAESFNMYFNGVESWALLADEATLWCEDNGKDLDTRNLKSTLKMYFPQFSSSKKGKDARKMVTITTYTGNKEYVKVLGGRASSADNRTVLSKKNSLEDETMPNKRKSIELVHKTDRQSAITFIEKNGLTNIYRQQGLDL